MKLTTPILTVDYDTDDHSYNIAPLQAAFPEMALDEIFLSLKEQPQHIYVEGDCVIVRYVKRYMTVFGLVDDQTFAVIYGLGRIIKKYQPLQDTDNRYVIEFADDELRHLFKGRKIEIEAKDLVYLHSTINRE